RRAVRPWLASGAPICRSAPTTAPGGPRSGDLTNNGADHRPARRRGRIDGWDLSEGTSGRPFPGRWEPWAGIVVAAPVLRTGPVAACPEAFRPGTAGDR